MLVDMATVLYFAGIRDALGRSEESMDLPADVRTVQDFVLHVQQRYPVLQGKMASVRIALDEAFAQDSDALADARVIALIPPVAGG